MRAPLVLLLLAAIVPAAALAQGGEPEHMIHMIEYDYLPETLEVPPGAVVAGMNFGPRDQSLPKEQWGEYYHTITAVERSLFDVQRIPPDTSAHTFAAPTTPGTYPYYCVYHGAPDGSGMAGVLVVKENAAPTTTPAAPTATATPASEDNDTPLAPALALLGLALAAFGRARRS